MRMLNAALVIFGVMLGSSQAIACKSTDGTSEGFLDDASGALASNASGALAMGCPPETACTQPYSLSPLFHRMIPGSTESPNPVFTGGGCHGVIKTPTYSGSGLRRYKLFMSGEFGGVDGVFRSTASNSSNGTDWVQPFTSSHLVLPGNTDWLEGIKCPDLYYEPDNTLVMYFKGLSSTQPGIGRARSTDHGITWSVQPASGPVMISDQAWEIEPPYLGTEQYIDSPSVIRHVAKRKDPQGAIQTYTYMMAYQGVALRFEGKIGIAYSNDGIQWVKREENHPLGVDFGNPVIVPGACTSGRMPWDSMTAARPRLVPDPCDPATIHLFYTGLPLREPGSIGGSCSRIGFASSTDYGITWTKYANNPAFEISTDINDWDHGSLDHYAASFVTSDNLQKLRMYYIGVVGAFRLGVADAAWAAFPRNVGTHCPIGPYEPIEPQGTTETRLEDGVDLALAITPTPARSEAMISFIVPSSGLVTVRVFDAGGRRVAEPYSGHLSPGRHEIPMRRGDLASGIYTVTVSSNSWKQSAKLTWIR